MVAEGAKSIFLPVGQGIAGTVAASGECINIEDAYADSRFDSSHDKATGYRTRSILCAPVKDGSGRIVGVIQAINRAGGPFTGVDQEILTILAAQAGIALRNAELYVVPLARSGCSAIHVAYVAPMLCLLQLPHVCGKSGEGARSAGDHQGHALRPRHQLVDVHHHTAGAHHRGRRPVLVLPGEPLQAGAVDAAG